MSGIDDLIHWPQRGERVIGIVRVRDDFIVTTDHGVYRVRDAAPGLEYTIELLAVLL